MDYRVVLSVVLAAVLSSGAVWAGEGKGKGQDKKHEKNEKDKDRENDKGNGRRPPGWSKGNKTGWRGEFPPGWEKKSDKEKDTWHEDYEEAVEKVGKEADKKTIDPERRGRLQEATERIIRKGTEAKKAAEDVIDALKRGVDVDIIVRGN